mgnify:CR=1 FL=1
MRKNIGQQNKEDAFIQEVNEELKNEKIRNIWNNYGLYIIAFIVAVLTAAVSFETFKNWHDKKHQNISDVYAVAVALQGQGKYEDSLRILKDLEKKAGSSIYGQLSQLQRANILAEQEKEINKSLHDVAVIKLASYKLDNSSYQDIEKLLKPLIDENGNWTAIAQEMLAMSAIYAKNFEQAKELYARAAENPNAPDELKSRAQDMLLILDEEIK